MESTTAVPANHYFKSIDGLRLLASANIVLFHLERNGGFAEMQCSPGWFFLLVKGPAFHASLFFILAGFIYTIKYAAGADDFSARRFLTSRFRTLYPLHAIMTVAMVPLVVVPSLGGAGLHLPKLVFSCFMHLSLLWSVFPFHSYDLNTPSWALSAFFVCYLMLGPALRTVVRLESRRQVFLALACCWLLLAAWTGLYWLVGFPGGLYVFFHVFAPARFIEFAGGMLLARLYQLSTSKTGGQGLLSRPLVNDACIAALLVTGYQILKLQNHALGFVRWSAYHVLIIPIYAALLYRLARGAGVFARIGAIGLVRRLGQSSFYPYLIHIPLASWVCQIAARYWDYPTILHSPWNIAAFMLALYSLSGLYSENVKKKRKMKTPPRPGPGREAVSRNAGGVAC